MTLYLVRHGAAGSGDVDRERPLTTLGRDETEALRAEMERQQVRPDRIFHSGYRRARETAEILAPLCGSDPRAHSGMTPEDDPDIFLAELGEIRGATMVVSHLPYLPHLCEQLLQSASSLPRFGTATAVRLDPAGEAGGRRGWQLVWQINGRDVLLGR